MDGTMQMICDLSNAVLLVTQADVVRCGALAGFTRFCKKERAAIACGS